MCEGLSNQIIKHFDCQSSCLLLLLEVYKNQGRSRGWTKGTGPKAFMRTKFLSFILHLYFPKSLIIQSAGYPVKQLFREITS